ncbi:MAG TPA: DUF3090 family protein [Ktedonobacterales bacterium]|nr:DUF3090 family protein [Ktedonobacterales bacterium]
MSREAYDFGRVDLLDAEAIGRPGRRRFRLFARARGRTAGLWIEREQLQALADAIDQVLAQLPGGETFRNLLPSQTEEVPSAPSDFPAHPDIEFQIGELSLGYDERDNVLAILATPIEVLEEEGGEMRAQRSEEPGFAARFSRDQASKLSQHIQGILSAGRPRCNLCGAPLGPEPHACPKQNGHHPIEIG